VRSDGARVGGTTWRTREYDRAKTQELVTLLLSFPEIESVLFNDPEIAGVTAWDNHDNHLHVRVRSRCG